MKWACVLVLAGAVYAQPRPDQSDDVWRHVTWHPAQHFPSLTLKPSQLSSIQDLLKSRVRLDGWSCADDDPSGEWLKDITFSTIPVLTRGSVILVQAGPGCARGGQGANGAMWLIRFDGATPTLIATPERGFSGWIYSVESTTSKGYRDIVIGWHVGLASPQPLNYFRFDGKVYQLISAATIRQDAQGQWRPLP